MLSCILTGCGGDSPKDTYSSELSGSQTESNDPTGGDDAGSNSYKGVNFNTIYDYTNAVTEIEGQHEAVINQYEDMPVLELPAAMLPIVTANMYEMLNLEEKDGRFEETEDSTGVTKFLEKKGTDIRFGFDGIRNQDGFSPDDKKGDRIVESGTLDGKKGHFKSESFTERAGSVLERSMVQCNLINGDTVAILYQFGKSSGENRTTSVFISAGKDHYDFVIGSDNSGPGFPELILDFSTAEEAAKRFEASGLKIVKSGGIQNGAFVVN